MAILKIVNHPDELLRKRSKEVVDFSPRLHQLLDDMLDTMDAVGGVGIAAVQVGVLWRVCIVATAKGIVEFINPVIVASDKVKEGEEACLSMPGTSGMVERAQKVTVRAQDRNGKFFERKFTGRDAVCVAHEFDHLDGVLYTDKVL